jgi:hypothetical protein
MRYVRNSALRATGASRNTVNLRSRLRREVQLREEVSANARQSANVIGEIGKAVFSVKTPNGTTRKIARLIDGFTG